MAKIEASINDHDALEVFDWARNFLTQAQTGAESGVGGTTRKHRKVSLDTLRALLVEVANVVNDLTTTVPGKVLDARQGKVLADTIQAEIAKYAQPNGIATLGSDGKVPASQIPSIALVDVFTVADETAMLALDAEQGDMAIRTDSNQVFILSASPASTLANWVELSALKALVDAAIAEVRGEGYTSGTLKSHEDRLNTLEGTGEGSVADDIAKYAVKLTKMPDGATAVYSNAEFTVTSPWQPNSGSVSVIDGELVFTNNGGYYAGIIPNASGKVCLTRMKRATSGTISLDFRVDGVYPTQKTFQANADEYTILLAQIPIGTTVDRIRFSGMSGISSTIDWIWIGDYSYLADSLSTEASRIANQLGDTTGVGTSATGTITSNGTNVSDGDTVTIARKVYTFKTILGTTEGNVLIGGTAAESLDNLKLAINSIGVTAEQYCATFHPLVEATTNTDTMQTLVARSVGLLGNSITLAKSASTLTISGSTLSGGTDDVGQKIYTQVKDIVAGGTRPAQADISDTSTIIGYENSVDVASGGTTTLPAGGTFRWAVYGYGATISSAKKGTSAGGTTLTVAGANATVWYRRIA